MHEVRFEHTEARLIPASARSRDPGERNSSDGFVVHDIFIVFVKLYTPKT